MGLEGLLTAERGQHRDQSLGEHRLAHPRWPRHQQVVTTGRRELQGQPRLRLADDVGEVGPGPSRDRDHVRWRRGRERRAVLGRDVPVDDVAQAPGPVHRHPVDELRLTDVLDRHDDVPRPGPGRGEHRRQDAVHAPDPPVERQLAQVDDVVGDATLDHPGGRQHRDGDRQVEARPALGDGGRREVDRDPVGGHGHPAVRGRGPHPVGRLRARGVGHAADREVRQPLRDVRLDVDDGAVEAGQRDRAGAPQAVRHDPTPTTCRTTAGRPGRHRMPTTSTRTCAARAPSACPAR